jgi:hypothetical protein
MRQQVVLIRLWKYVQTGLRIFAVVDDTGERSQQTFRQACAEGQPLLTSAKSVGRFR